MNLFPHFAEPTISTYKMKSFYRNKTILVTGAASGIGRRFAERVSHFGVTLILWDRNPDILADIKNSLHANTEVLVTGIDVTDPESIEKETDQIIKSSFVPDIIVNCAGVVTGKYFQDHTKEEIASILNINTAGSMYVVRAFLPAMIERGSGHVVNLASASAYIGNPKMSVYSASKWAILGWSESLRLEMKQQNTGIRVSCVIPSYVDTGMFDGVDAPFLVPILRTDTLVRKMLRGIRWRRFKIQAPFMVRTVPILKVLLPRFLFDWIAGSVLGVYHSMNTFKGRENNSS